MAVIVWTEPALADLDAVADYIALDKPDAAARFVRRIFASVESLSEHPQLGSRIPELLPDSNHRQIVERPCRIFYRFDLQQNTVYVLGVMRGERLFRRSLLASRKKN